MKKHKWLIMTLFAAVVVMATAWAGGVEEMLYLSTAVPLIGAALTQDRDTASRSGDAVSMGVAAAKKIFAGALTARDANGYATPGATATTLLGAGRAAELADNTGGANGAISVLVEKGVFKFANSAAGDQITIADIGNDCYIVDDQTVAKTNGTGTRSVAGKVFDVESDGVWVKFS